MRVLITGITGFIGGHLAERLLSDGFELRGLVREPASAGWLAQQGADLCQGDLRQLSSLKKAVQDCDIVLHAAAWTGEPGLSGTQAWLINVVATRHLLEAARQSGVQQFIYFSSVAVYGINRSAVIDEGASIFPVGQLYPDSKIAAETLVRYAQTQGLQTTIIRPASTYGPRGVAWSVRPIESIKSGRLVLLGKDAGLVNTGYIDNVVDGVSLAMNNPSAFGETFNLCDGTVVTYREFYLRYARMLGKQGLPTMPAWLARGAATAPGRFLRGLLGRQVPGPWSVHFRFNPSRFSVEKAQRVLGYQPMIDFETGMRHTEEWLREAGYLKMTGS
ncbi:MAG: NAD(P)-dependent oxidoreductase [Chloroflexota bacterium]|nr:NAD(P)-dependent oxidoreductase [Chloroflexota bacterium]